MLGPEYGNMGTNIGYFYFGVTVEILVLVFPFVPETSQLTSEQIDDVFEMGRKAWRTSPRGNKAVSREIRRDEWVEDRVERKVQGRLCVVKIYCSAIAGC